ncbi:DUF4251 domain-containing protein [Polaribacter porphyrae]|uniref:DUF4251 domain-containing protein n=1 Tax=Polaribacter porphyrae TaxID=1137780 RepID=A0A2S7WM11_9FLAO|nr:DUF4251 domain-containing protein [Polaribacter porphyrae]PQJ78352.1 hypothetical protein BTO18_03725 [Polaribacter porphyrae]
MKKVLLFVIIMVTVSCSSSKNFLSEEQIVELEKIIKSNSIEVNFEWANPLSTSSLIVMNNLLPPGNTSSNISLLGNPNYLKIDKDSIKINLPYFGEQRIVNNYGSTNTGIKYNGEIVSKKIVFNQKKKAYQLKFSFNNKQEGYNAHLTLFQNKKANININSTHRTMITYYGNWTVLEDKKVE